MSFFNRIRADPGFVSPVRSDPDFVSPIRSGPIRSDPGFVNGPAQLCLEIILVLSYRSMLNPNSFDETVM